RNSEKRFLRGGRDFVERRPVILQWVIDGVRWWFGGRPLPARGWALRPVTAREKAVPGMGLWTLLEGLLLLANALAILNEDRFLAPRGWGFQEFPGGKAKSLKGQVIGLIYATQYLRVPLIILNSICIIIKLVSG
ncbi:hypothetical protein EUGRSUZ_E00256, partial [Eucalyptus grandis]